VQKINVFYSLYAPDLYRGAEGDFENDLNPEALVPVSTVEVTFIPKISDAHFFISIGEEEYYTDQGIKVDLMKFQSAHQAPPSRINGAFDVLSDIVSPGAFNAVAKGSNIKIVVDKGRYAPDFCPAESILVRRNLHDSGAVTTLSQLNDSGMVKSFELSYF